MKKRLSTGWELSSAVFHRVELEILFFQRRKIIIRELIEGKLRHFPVTRRYLRNKALTFLSKCLYAG